MLLALFRAFTEIRFCGFRWNRKTANVPLQISTIELLRFRVSTAFVETQNRHAMLEQEHPDEA